MKLSVFSGHYRNYHHDPVIVKKELVADKNPPRFPNRCYIVYERPLFDVKAVYIWEKGKRGNVRMALEIFNL